MTRRRLTTNDEPGPSPEIPKEPNGHQPEHGDRQRAPTAALADALGPDPLRRNRHSTSGADVSVRRAQRPRPRPRRHHHSHRHGGDAVHRHQLWTHGARLSQRRFRFHLRWPGNQSRPGLRHRLEHGDGLHAQSDDLHHLVQPAGARLCSRRSLCRLGRLLRRCIHGPEHSGREDVGAREHRCWPPAWAW